MSFLFEPSMNVAEAYAQWANIYDTNKNRTRDLEAAVLREVIGQIDFKNCLEIGCGTGKNTVWLADRGMPVKAIDLSAEMLEKAREKVTAAHVVFEQIDIINQWNIASQHYDLAIFSLVLEHIEDLAPVLKQAADALTPNGVLYICELHPFKQYSGSQARFETEHGVELVPCFVHHLSDFTEGAQSAGLVLEHVREFFDDGDRTQIPRLLQFTFRKPF